MSTSKQPEALRLAAALAYCDSSVASQAATELRRTHAENTTLQAGYDAARLEIDSLRASHQNAQGNVALLADILNRRPAMNAGLVEAYGRWTQEVYDLMGAMDAEPANDADRAVCAQAACDTPNYCRSVQRCTAQEDKRAQAAPEVPADPMDWPLPCDVTVGHGTMRKGVSLRTLVARMKMLYEMATGNNADEVANRTPEQRTALLEAFRAQVGAAPQPPAAEDADGAAFRTAARLGLTLRFHGGCAQSGMPGSPSAYEVVHDQDSAAAMRRAVEQAEAVIAGGGEPQRLNASEPPAEVQEPVKRGNWLWVPEEPTTGMLIAGNHGQPGDFSARKVWKDMLVAALRSAELSYIRPVDPPANQSPQQAAPAEATGEQP